VSVPSPPIEAKQPATAPPTPHFGGEEIPLFKKGGIYQLPVEINGVITLTFVLDTGAADVNIPADVALILIRMETIRDGDFLPGMTYKLADGSTVKSPRFLLRSLKIGNRRVANVAASIGPVSSELLLGQSFLEKLGAWGIDSKRQVLTLGAPKQRKQPTPLQSPPSTPRGPEMAVEVYSPQPMAPQTLRNSLGMEFLRIEAGMFLMGSNDGNSDEKPVHMVHISRPFYLGKYEVTQAQWQPVMGHNPSQFKGDSHRPVEQVSWDDVQEFIRRLNTKESGARYRLPTEAEWEYAARAGSTTAYSFGDGVSQLGQYAWCDSNAVVTTYSIGRLQPNAWGLHDMHGNVSEWVQDWYASYDPETAGQLCSHSSSDGRSYYTSCFTDPVGPLSGSGRVVRGGSWYSKARFCQSACRSFYAPSTRINDVGFRLLRDIP
jgi:formylglycine-generating enzyme required for sulfatase activity